MAAPSKEEENVLVQFRGVIAGIGLVLAEEDTTDLRLLAWLRARDLDVHAAAEMLKKSLEWRKENEIQNILEWEPPPDYHQKFPYNAVGTDKEGRPVWVVPLGKWDFRRTIQSEERETCIKYVDQALATLQKRMRESSVESGREVTQFVLIGDCEHFSYSQLLSFGCIETLIELARHFDSNYPEFLSKAYLINSSRVWLIAFEILKRFMTKRTSDKMELFASPDQWKPYLLARISPDQIPKEFGGNL